MKRKIFTALLSAAVILTSAVTPASALELATQGTNVALSASATSLVPFKDMGNHWAAAQVEEWTKAGIISGYDDGSFRPNAQITKAEFSVLLGKILKYSKESSESFTDVHPEAWYYKSVLQARAAGLITGYNGHFEPMKPITRQDAALIVSKAFELQRQVDTSKSDYKDFSLTAAYAQDAVAAMIDNGYLKGYTDNTLQPQKTLTRAEAVVLLANSTGVLVYKSGEQSGITTEGNVVVNTSGAILKDSRIAENLYLTAGIGEGEATLDHITVNGILYVAGGGMNSILVQDSSIAEMVIKKKEGPVRTRIEGGTSIGELRVDTTANIEMSGEVSIGKLTIGQGSNGTTIETKGHIQSLISEASDVTVNGIAVTQGTVLELKNGAIVQNVRPTATPQVAVSGTGSLPTLTPEIGNPATETPATPETPEEASPWTLVMDDEFDETSLDNEKWTAMDTGTVYNNEAEYYRDSNVYLEDGKLVLEAKKEDYGDKQYTSGKVVTAGKESWTYGKFEIKAKLPQGQGIWPAIWMLPEDDSIYGQWPIGGEIDITELLGHEPNKIYGTLHYGDAHVQGQGSSSLPAGQSFADDYHVYSLEWEPGEIRWYIDGQLYHTENSWFSHNLNEAAPFTYPAPFDRDFHLIMNLAVGGDWPGFPDETTMFPAKMYVDYVKVYSLTGRPYRTAGERPDGGDTEARQPLEDGNYIYNGSFDQNIDGVKGMENNDGKGDIAGTSYWTFSHVAANEGAAIASAEDGALKIEVSEPGVNLHSVQIYQKPIELQKGETYTVSYDARTSQDRTLTVKLGSEEDRGWSNYSDDQTVPLTTEMTNYSFTFKMTGESNTSARLEFNLGQQGANTVWLDNVQVKKLPKDPNAAREPLESGNLVYNGTFDQGSKSLEFWNFLTTSDTVAAGSVSTDPYAREFKAEITDGGVSTEDVRLVQDKLHLEKGKLYQIQFSAYADKNRSMEVSLGNADDSAVSYSGVKKIELSNTSGLYTLPFEMEMDTDTNARLEFRLGGNDGAVFIDNVSVQPHVPTQAIHLDAQNGAAYGNTAILNGYAVFNEEASALTFSNISIPDSGKYAISYRLQPNNDASSLGMADSAYKVAVSDNEGSRNWRTVTNTVYLNAGEQDITFEGSGLTLDWLELSPELMVNGNMNKSDGWVFWSTADEKATANIAYADGQASFDISAVGSNPWSVGFQQQGLKLETGKHYRLSFDASSTQARTISVSTENLTTYKRYMEHTIPLEQAVRNFVIDFTMKEPMDTNAALSITLGNVNQQESQSLGRHIITLDNVRLMEVNDQLSSEVNINEASIIFEPAPESDNNLIPDGNFSADLASWTLYGGTGSADMNVVNGELEVSIHQPGISNYEPDIATSGISLEEGQSYELTFKSRASLPRSMEVNFIDPDNNYHYFGGQIFALSTEAEVYKYIFTADATTNTAKLQFNLGTISAENAISIPATIYLDDIVLLKQQP